MNKKEKNILLQNLIDHSGAETDYHKLVEDMCDVSVNYGDYMTTHPINCDKELERVATADYELCIALLTMLLREDHFCGGTFIRRYKNGQVQKILRRMLYLLNNEY